MTEKKERSDVVRECTVAACNKWFLESGRHVSGKIFYRILAALEAAMPVHFSLRKPAVVEEPLPLEKFMSPTHSPISVGYPPNQWEISPLLVPTTLVGIEEINARGDTILGLPPREPATPEGTPVAKVIDFGGAVAPKKKVHIVANNYK